MTEIDTDSLFVKLGEFILDNIKDKNKWINLTNNKKIEYIKRISKAMEKYVDYRIFNETQLGDYNSQVHDFPVSFKQEIISKTMLAIKKKKYCYWLLDKEGIPENKIKVTGLELVRSETAEAIRPRLKDIMEMILKNKSDDEIAKTVRKYRKELNELDPEGLAANIGINGIRKYLGSKKPGNPKKGTPYHVKGVYGYRLLLRELGIHNKYEDIHEGLKSKVVYIKKNPYNIETISFYEWPSEFEGVIQLDSEKMIEKFFIKKIKFLLNPMGKEDIIDGNKNAVKLFF